MTTEAPPVAVSPFLRDWINERRSWPWPIDHYRLAESVIPASELYAEYVAAATEEVDRAVVNQKDFASSTDALEIERDRIQSGSVYRGLFGRTRRAQAEFTIRYALGEPIRQRLHDEAEADHMARIPHTRVKKVRVDAGLYGVGQYANPYTVEEVESVPCTHDMPQAVHDQITAQVDAELARLDADGTVARTVEERYGVYLRWTVGEPDPGITIRRARDEARLAKLRAELAIARPVLDSTQADADELRAQHLALRSVLTPHPYNRRCAERHCDHPHHEWERVYKEWQELVTEPARSDARPRPLLLIIGEYVESLEAQITSLTADLCPEAVATTDDGW